jgi:hypothetical protein
LVSGARAKTPLTSRSPFAQCGPDLLLFQIELRHERAHGIRVEFVLVISQKLGSSRLDCGQPQAKLHLQPLCARLGVLPDLVSLLRP